MDDVFVQGVIALITIAGTAIAVSNFLTDRFQKLTVDLGALMTEQAVDSAVQNERIGKLESRIEDTIIYRINANTELINHRTHRFDESLNRSEAVQRERHESIRHQLTESRDIILNKIERLDKELNDIQQFLAKTSEFKIRD